MTINNKNKNPPSIFTSEKQREFTEQYEAAIKEQEFIANKQRDNLLKIASTSFGREWLCGLFEETGVFEFMPKHQAAQERNIYADGRKSVGQNIYLGVIDIMPDFHVKIKEDGGIYAKKQI